MSALPERLQVVPRHARENVIGCRIAERYQHSTIGAPRQKSIKEPFETRSGKAPDNVLIISKYVP